MQVAEKRKFTKEQFQEYIPTLSLEDLLKLKIEIEHEHSEVKSQLTAARAKASTTGEYASPDWFRKAEQARAVKRSQLGMIELELMRRAASSVESLKYYANQVAFLAKFHEYARLHYPESMTELENLAKLDTENAKTA